MDRMMMKPDSRTDTDKPGHVWWRPVTKEGGKETGRTRTHPLGVSDCPVAVR